MSACGLGPPGGRKRTQEAPRGAQMALGLFPPPAIIAVTRDLPPLDQCDLITQVYAGQQEPPLREFDSYYNGPCRNDATCLTSQEASRSSVLPLYSTYQHSVKWDSEQSQRTDHDYNCRCIDCRSPRCPETIARLSSNPTDIRNFRFKNNIMTFCDQNTMTSKVNDVSCGICLGVGCLQTENKCVAASPCPERPAGRIPLITRRKPCSVSLEPVCSRAPPVMKRVRHYRPKRDRRRTAAHQDCSTYGCRRRRDYQEEAVRDTDPLSPYRYEQLEDNCRYPPIEVEIEQRCSLMNHDNLDSIKFAGRKTLYNEGISDNIANNLPMRVTQRRPSTQVFRPTSNVSIGPDNWIPYSHRGTSRYHSECKKPQEVRYRGDCGPAPGDYYGAPEYYRRHGKKSASKYPEPVVYPYYTQPPRKVLASEKNIDSYIISQALYENNYGNSYDD
ncbi:hypothetical protein NE865_13418 [Phthorimaea operculella]|nr:hypothetical protein NE865_13418 [Phthorimaea operculella]